MSRHGPLSSRLDLDTLEARELLSSSQLLVESFQRGPSAGLPTGWSQWSNDGSRSFQVDSLGAGLGDTGRLVTDGRSTTAARAWVSAPFSADVESSVAIFLNSTNPVQLIVRGQNLHTNTPTYYGVSVVRGGELQLTRVVNGTATVLGKVSSSEWVSNRWVQLTVRAEGDRIQATLHRGDTNSYLGSDGKWTRRAAPAIDIQDRSIRTSGVVGISRPAGAAGQILADSLRVSPSNAATRDTLAEDRFEVQASPGLPRGWSAWSSGGSFDYRTTGDDTLRVEGPSTGASRAWQERSLPSDLQVSSSIYVDSLVPAGVIARGVNLHRTTPTYYGVTVTRGVEMKLVRVVNGVETVIGSIRSQDWVAGLWMQVSLTVKGSELKTQLFRTDTGEYLNPDGKWSLTPAWALSVTDRTITDGERAGLFRSAGYAGPLIFDNFLVTAAPDRLVKAEPIPTERDKANTPAISIPDDRGPPANPLPTVPPTVPPPPASQPAGLPAVPRNYSHIRLANLAYWGTPFGDFEQSLLQNSIDLVIANNAYLEDIARVSPNTPQFVYTNLSNIYLGLYTDWLEYADRNKLNRESAFYHVTRATAYSGKSASAVPVNRFWGVYRGSDAAGWTDVTRESRTTNAPVPFASRGLSLAFGYTERFREMNFQLQNVAPAGWSGRIEYVRAVDAQGNPTAWGTLPLTADSTSAFRRSGRIEFDPPRDWKPASIGGSDRLYYVRVVTLSGTSVPVVNTVTGRDYVNDRGAAGGVIPAFDTQADKDGDGYLNDREWATRRKGFDARFVYESRLFFPNYGTMRFATNVADPGFRAWSSDFLRRVAGSLPLATGFFVDNSNGKLAVDPTGIAESLENYAQNYGTLLGTVNRQLGANRWLIANTSGGGTAAEPIARQGVSYLEEFGLRPLATNHVQFDDLFATLTYRRQLSEGRSYEILDSLLQGVDPSDPRAQLTTLSMYYLVADPDRSFLMMNGGNEPNTTWTRHWTDAATFNVGRPTGNLSLFAQGLDPSDRALTYKIYQRQYQNALVLYKPLSYVRGRTGTTANNTATTHQLDGFYRPLRADGSLGSPTNRITLRNGEGVVLVKAR